MSSQSEENLNDVEDEVATLFKLGKRSSSETQIDAPPSKMTKTTPNTKFEETFNSEQQHFPLLDEKQITQASDYCLSVVCMDNGQMRDTVREKTTPSGDALPEIKTPNKISSDTVKIETIDAVSLNIIQLEEQLATFQTETKQMFNETQMQEGLGTDQKPSDNVEPLDNNHEISKISSERNLLSINQVEMLKIPNVVQIQDVSRIGEKLLKKVEPLENISEKDTTTENLRIISEESQMAINNIIALKTPDEVQIQDVSQVDKELLENVEPLEITSEKENETENLRISSEETQLAINSIIALKTPDEVQIQNVSPIGKKLLKKVESLEIFLKKDSETENLGTSPLKVERLEIIFKKDCETENLRMSSEESQMAINNILALKTPDEVQIQDVSNTGEKILNKVQPLEIISKRTNEIENVRISTEETQVAMNNIIALKTSDDTQIEEGSNFDQKLSDKVEPLQAYADKSNDIGLSTRTSEENRLAINQVTKLKTTDEVQTLDGSGSDLKFSGKVEPIEIFSGNINQVVQYEPFKAARSSLIQSENLRMNENVMESFSNQSNVSKDQPQCANDPDQRLSDIVTVEEQEVLPQNTSQSESEVNKFDNCREESVSVKDPVEKNEMSVEEVNKLDIKEEVATPWSMKDKYETDVFKHQVTNDPVWKDRLPPPPGCESPPSHTPSDNLYFGQGFNVKSTLDTAKIFKTATTTTVGHHEMIFEINHLPKFTVFYLLKKMAVQDENCVEKFSGASVKVRGSYAPPGSAMLIQNTTDQFKRLLHLYITGPSKQSLELAVKYIEKLIAEGEEDEDIFVAKMLVGVTMMNTSGFNMNERIMGPSGANLQYIADATGAEVTLRGRSSSYVEFNSGQEALLPLHIRIRHTTLKLLTQAKSIASNLIETINEEFKQLTSQSQQTVSAYAVYAVPTPVPSPFSQTTSSVPTLTAASVIPPPTLDPSLYVQTVAAPFHSDTSLVSPPSIPVTSVNCGNPEIYKAQINQAGNSSGPKAVYEASPQLRRQVQPSSASTTTIVKPINIPLTSPSSSEQTSVPIRDILPAVQLSKPPRPLNVLPPTLNVPPPTLNVPPPTLNVPPPPLRNPPSATPLHLRPSPLPFSPEMRNALTFRPQSKKEDSETEANKLSKGVPESLKGKCFKPQKIQFSIITATKKNKIEAANPLVSKKLSNASDKPSEVDAASSSSVESKINKTRWGENYQDSTTQGSKINQLLKSFSEHINDMRSGRDKSRLETISQLLQNSVPQTKEINDKEKAQLVVLVDLIQKTLKYLPSNQLSKTLWQIYKFVKDEFNVGTEEKLLETRVTSNKRTVLIKEVKPHHETVKRERTRNREREDKSYSSKRCASSINHSQELKRNKEHQRTYSGRPSDARSTASTTRQNDSVKTASYKHSKEVAEITHSQFLHRKRSPGAHDEQRKPIVMKSEVLSHEPEVLSPKSEFLSPKPEVLSPKAEMLSPKTEDLSPKTEDLSPKPSKMQSTDELTQIVELLHEALKAATHSLENHTVKYELEQITQLLKLAVPPSSEASAERKSQFLIVLDMLEKALQRNISALGDRGTHLTSIISLLKNNPNLNKTSVKQEVIKASVNSASTVTSTQSSEIRKLSETQVKQETDQPSDPFAFITKLFQEALKTYASRIEHGIMKTQITVVSQSLEKALSKSGNSTEEKLSLLTVIELLEKLLSTNQPSSSNKPTELLGIMQQLKNVLKPKTGGSFDHFSKENAPTNMQTQNTPIFGGQNLFPSFNTIPQQTSKVSVDQSKSELIQILRLLQQALHGNCNVLEQGYQKDKLTQISQMLDRELEEHMNTMSSEQLKRQVSPLIAMLQQTVQNQPSSNESKGLLLILQQISKILNPPAQFSIDNVTPVSLFGSLQQLQMLQTLQQGVQMGSGLPFQPIPVQAAPINNLLQLQMMQMMQNALTSQTQQSSTGNQLNQLSQQLQTMQQQFMQLNQQPSLLQSLPAAGTMPTSQPDLSTLMMQLQQQTLQTQQYKGGD